MKPAHVLLPVAVAAVLCCVPATAGAETVQTRLRGYEEVPSISSAAEGRFRARIDTAAGRIAYQLSYDDLQGEVRQAHIHFGQRGVNGGVSVFLCQTADAPDPTGLAPICPASGSVAGLLRADNVVGPGNQGLSAGEFAELVAAIRAGVAYVNVHTTAFPAGEIRGQLNAVRNLLGGH